MVVQSKFYARGIYKALFLRNVGGTMKNIRKIRIAKICLIILSIYFIFAVSFYYLAGDQLLYRQSRGNIDLPTAEAGTIEMAENMSVEQIFSAKIQRLESVSVQWTTNYRENVGNVSMELYDLTKNKLLARQTIDAASVNEGQIITLNMPEPIEDVYDVPLLIKLYGDSTWGNAITPLKTNNMLEENFSLLINGESISGMLCFSAYGTDYIWTGLHYWKFTLLGAFIVFVSVWVILNRYGRGKHSYIISAIQAIQKYKFLIKQLVSRDFKTKYKRSILGVLWSFLNPLLTMIVQYVVFSTIFKADILNYPVYLLIGIVCFNFFSEACGMALTSILGNASLITKVYMPKYIYPLTRVLSSVINLGISLIPLLLVALVTGVHFEKSAILAIYFLICLMIFSLGLGMLLSASMVFFRDTQFLWNVISMIWMYATPIFYPETILPDTFRVILDINPLYHFLKNIRLCILNGISPEPIVYVQCFIMSAVMLFIGAITFRKTQNKFILYL